MDNDHKKPASVRDFDPKTKPCLVCKSPFLSEWAGERICRRCKSTRGLAERSGQQNALILPPESCPQRRVFACLRSRASSIPTQGTTVLNP